MTEGRDWRHYFIARDEGATLIEMERALFAGWNVRKIYEQGAVDWPGMTADQIIAWKLHSNERTSECSPEVAATVLDLLARKRAEATKP